MEIEDIAAVMEVERLSFTTPWPANAYRRELKENRLAHYFVARRTGPAHRNTSATVLPAPPSQGRSGGWRGLLDRLFSPQGSPEATASALDEKAARVVGYAGLWLMVDEAHITSIAVTPAYRGLGLGELLLIELVDAAREIGAQYLTLEVRVSNQVAHGLYRKYTFKQTGVRRKYYSDNNEDAAIMWSDPLDSPSFLGSVEENRRLLMERLKSPQVHAELRTRGVEA